MLDYHGRNVVVKIIAVIDYHPSFIEFKSIPHYLNQPASSTSCLIYQGKEDEFMREELELAMVTEMIDTVSFLSTKFSLELDYSLVFCASSRGMMSI